MTATQARAIAQSLLDAADIADEQELEEVDLLSTLQQADDTARAELQAAIDAAQ